MRLDQNCWVTNKQVFLSLLIKLMIPLKTTYLAEITRYIQDLLIIYKKKKKSYTGVKLNCTNFLVSSAVFLIWLKKKRMKKKENVFINYTFMIRYKSASKFLQYFGKVKVQFRNLGFLDRCREGNKPHLTVRCRGCLVLTVCYSPDLPLYRRWFGLVSLFNSISTFVGYLKPKLFSWTVVVLFNP